MYGTIMCFDRETEEQIKQLWTMLADQNISTYHIDKNGQWKRPHITLADYDDLDLENYIARFDAFFANRKPLDIDLSILGSFPSKGTLFFAPVMSSELSQLHSDYHQAFETFKDSDQSFYIPGHWVPHCTIANHLDQDNLVKAYASAANTFRPMKAKVCEIILIRLIFDQGNVTGSEPVLNYHF